MVMIAIGRNAKRSSRPSAFVELAARKRLLGHDIAYRIV
jgi:hypothetical protein